MSQSKEVVIKGTGYRIVIEKDMKRTPIQKPTIRYYDTTGHLIFEIQVSQENKFVEITTYEPNNDYKFSRGKSQSSLRYMG